MRQNKFLLQPFSKRTMISPTFVYPLGYKSPTADIIQIQIKPSLPKPALYDVKVLLVHEAPHLGQRVQFFLSLMLRGFHQMPFGIRRLINKIALALKLCALCNCAYSHVRSYASTESLPVKAVCRDVSCTVYCQQQCKQHIYSK